MNAIRMNEKYYSSDSMDRLTKESIPNRGDKGKEKVFTRVLKTELIEFEGTENEIAENANLCMLE